MTTREVVERLAPVARPIATRSPRQRTDRFELRPAPELADGGRLAGTLSELLEGATVEQAPGFVPAQPGAIKTRTIL